MGMGGRAVAFAAVAAVLAAGAPGARAAPELGISDDLAFVDSRAEPRARAFQAARRAGARAVRITLDWSLVAPPGQTKPAGFDAADPSAPGYRWGYIEDAVRDASRRRLRVIIVVVRAPAWAEGAGRPAGAPPGSWRPDPGELAAFVRAAARRFSGFYPDPKQSGDGLTRPGRALPPVRRWQIWDEPNARRSLLPVTGAVGHYRRMLNAAATALKRVDGANVVVAAGTAARGRIAPLPFWRRLMCASRPSPCARFDVAAHHPVTGRAPGAAGRAGELGLRRLGELKRVVGRKPLWLTRLEWGTRPRHPGGVSPRRQARYLLEALYLADRAGVSLAVWRGLRDRPSYLPASFRSVASGLYFGHGAPKPALGAYRFPFLVRSAGGGAMGWGMAPTSGRPVAIERRVAGTWRVVRTPRADGSREFRVPLPATGGPYRARQAGVTSLEWRR
jgi:hypothetical protein